MAGTHFKGPLLFSAQRPSLQNLNTSMWPDQFHYMDDFDDGAIDETLKSLDYCKRYWSSCCSRRFCHW